MGNILIISCVFPPEPVVSAQISKDVAAGLNSKRHKVTVLAPEPSRPAGFSFRDFEKMGSQKYFNELLNGVKVVRLSSKTYPQSNFIGRLKESYSFGKHVSVYVADHKDVIDVLYINSWPIFSQYLIAKTCMRFNIPYVIHIQDIYPESLSNKLSYGIGVIANILLMPFEKYHLRNARRIIAISENMKSHLIQSRGLDENKIAVVYNWQDEESFNRIDTHNSRKDKFTFMYLGNIGPVAGVELLIKAFHLANLPDAALVIAGSGASKNGCVELASTFLDTDISFTEVPEGAVAEVQQQADILLLPVIKGGAKSSIPSKLPAYMYSSKPIIATLDEASDTAKAIFEAGCGWVGPAEDYEWLASQMIEAYSLSGEELGKLGAAGYKYCAANFGKKVNLEKLLNQLTE